MVKWNGTNLASLGIIVENVPNIIKAKKNYTSYTIPGRNGALIVDNGTYNPFNLSLKCHFDTTTANIRQIAAFLDGYGKLSLDGTTEYTAMISNIITFEKVVQFRKFTLQFLVNPIAEEIQQRTATITTAVQTLTITQATAPMKPEITITCSGDISITINNETFYLYGANGTYTLDCKNKVIIDGTNANASHLMLGDFPELKPGDNEISSTGTITSFTIKYKKAYL